jgi:anti-sigma factor RsiW
MDDFLDRLRFQRDHRWAPGRMSAFLDGELSAQPRRRMERHLAECRECRRLLGGLTLVVDALHRLTTPEAGPSPVQLASSVITLIREPPAP